VFAREHGESSLSPVFLGRETKLVAVVVVVVVVVLRALTHSHTPRETAVTCPPTEEHLNSRSLFPSRGQQTPTIADGLFVQVAGTIQFTRGGGGEGGGGEEAEGKKTAAALRTGRA